MPCAHSMPSGCTSVMLCLKRTRACLLFEVRSSNYMESCRAVSSAQPRVQLAIPAVAVLPQPDCGAICL